MRRPPEVAAILERWRAEQLTLEELLGQLQACGWSRRDCYAFVEREAGGKPLEPPEPESLEPGAGSFRNGAKLINY